MITEEKPITGTGRPKTGYRNKEGKRIPGATTVISRFKESGGLVQWAYKCGLDGLDINQVRDDAADAGTCAHEMIDCELHEKEFVSLHWANTGTNTLDKAEHAFLAYLEWAEQSKLKLVASEVSLVSERHQFGGTFDAVMACGTLRLLDYKTSNGIYADYLIQVAGAYSLLWEEHHPDQPLHGMDLLRISKPKGEDDPVSFEHRHFSAEVFKPCQEQFLLLRRAYDLDKRIKGFV